jgi:hypothetical protein
MAAEGVQLAKPFQTGFTFDFRVIIPLHIIYCHFMVLNFSFSIHLRYPTLSFFSVFLSLFLPYFFPLFPVFKCFLFVLLSQLSARKESAYVKRGGRVSSIIVIGYFTEQCELLRANGSLRSKAMYY